MTNRDKENLVVISVAYTGDTIHRVAQGISWIVTLVVLTPLIAGLLHWARYWL